MRRFTHAAAMLITVMAMVMAPAAAVVFEPRDFASPAHEARYKALIDELRCLVCQNQNIADSNAPLAQDLRREVFRLLEQGRTDNEIHEYMVTRYGDFVLYRPPVKGVTLLLWAGPAVLVGIGLLILWHSLRRRRDAQPAALSPQEQARLDALLESDERR